MFKPLEIRYCKHGGLREQDASKLLARKPKDEVMAVLVVNWLGKCLFYAWFISDKPFRVYAGFNIQDCRRALEWSKAQSRQTGMVIRFEGPGFEGIVANGEMVQYTDEMSEDERTAWAISLGAIFLPNENDK